MTKMILANLAYRPLRSIISITAVAVEVTLILLIVGLALGMLHDSTTRQLGVGADVMVQPPGASVLLSFNGSNIPEKVGDLLRKQSHVVAVAPVVQHVTSTTNLELIYGIDLASYEAVGGPFRYVEGGPFQGPDDVIVDDYYAASNKVHAGQTIELFNHKFRVSGVVEHGRGGRRFLPLKVMQDLTGAEGKVSIFYLKLDDPAHATVVAQSIKSIPGMEDYSVLSMRDWVTLVSVDKIPMLSTFIHIVIGISVIIGFIVIFQSMYTAVMERTREIGILKSLGASKSYIVRVILREALVLALGGIVVGIVFSEIARAGIHLKVPTLPIEISWSWRLNATLIAAIGAIIGAIYPSFKAAQKDPIDALAYE